jgi:hypothetical protein
MRVSTTERDCAVAPLGTQDAVRMNHALICSLPDSLPHFSKLSHERLDFRRGKEIIEHKMCIEILSTTLSEIFFSTRTSERDTIKNTYIYI